MDELTDNLLNLTLSNNSTPKAFVPDKWNKWSSKSKGIPFKSTIRCIGNGENKLASELDVKRLGGQNSTIDIKHPELGNISVKDMTYDSCILGTEGSQRLRNIFRKIVNPLLTWCEKYKDKCDYANEISQKLQKTYGRSKINLLNGIERLELSNSNLIKLDQILEDVRKVDLPSTESEYIKDICQNLEGSSLIDKCNKCVRQEALDMTLIVVHKSKGWMIIKDIDKITCPRITRGSPRISIIDSQ